MMSKNEWSPKTLELMGKIAIIIGAGVSVIFLIFLIVMGKICVVAPIQYLCSSELPLIMVGLIGATFAPGVSFLEMGWRRALKIEMNSVSESAKDTSDAIDRYNERHRKKMSNMG